MYFLARVTPSRAAPVATLPADAPFETPLPTPDYLEIEPNPPGPDVIMAGYADDGRFSGDSWHPTLDEAKQEALARYGVLLASWTPHSKTLASRFPGHAIAQPTWPPTHKG